LERSMEPWAAVLGLLGVLHVRDALVRPDASPAELARPVPLLGRDTTIPEAVSALQEAHAHVGLVTGGSTEGGLGGSEVVGMVSLTDLLGELLDMRVLAAR
ncbi:CBS domain-containing protein, partial [Streptosporangium algeriense]